MSDKKDLSCNCNFDDNDMDNNCFGCIHFVFPIGCMYFENYDYEENEEEINSDN
jgi:hypothetical protein